MGLPESPNFTELRTSIVSHVKNVLPNADREMLADFMCHDSQMKDKRYAMNPSKAGETSAFLETASKGEDTAPRAPQRTNPPPPERGRRERANPSPNGAPLLKRSRCRTGRTRNEAPTLKRSRCRTGRTRNEAPTLKRSRCRTGRTRNGTDGQTNL